MTSVERFTLRPGYDISRVICGGWQLAGGHGPVDRQAAVDDLMAFAKAGIFTFDCADIYTGVEDLLGAFRQECYNRHGEEAQSRIKLHTKFVPDLETLPGLRKSDVRQAVERSLRRLRVERLDLVQFHWWDYAVPGMIETALWLADVQREGKIDLIGGTNFDAPQTEALARAGVPLASMQVQYSLLDDRPEHGLIAVAQAHGIQLLCYGSVAGGFLSERWLGLPEPQPPFENRSLTKYQLIIDDFGGWKLFQELLGVLSRVARRHGSAIATAASAAILGRAQVAAVIVGTRHRRHLAENAAIGAVRLTGDERAEIDAVLKQRTGPPGDVFSLERDRAGRHGAIMKYNLSREKA